MTNPSIVTDFGKKIGISVGNLTALTPLAPRRDGVAIWSRSDEGERLRQPQDGAPVKAKLSAITAHLQGNVFKEPEDAGLTGGTRSLARRLMGLNLRNKNRKDTAMRVGSMGHPKVA